MSVRLPIFVLLLVSIRLLGCSAAQPPEKEIVQLDPSMLSASQAYDEMMALLEISPRDSGTPQNKAAAEHLLDRLKVLGLDAKMVTFEDASPQGPMTFRNVVGTWPGETDRLLILGSHFDTKSGLGDGFVGANDSGSSSGLLVELARVITSHPKLPWTVQFVFFDGEECHDHYAPNDGLHGSRYMASQLEKEGRLEFVEAMILLDMVGDRDLNITIPRNVDRRLQRLLLDAAYEEGVREKFSMYGRIVGDDHVPFLSRGIPSIDIIDFQYGSAPGKNDYWHTVQDTPDKISQESLATVGRVTLRMLNAMLREQASDR